MEHELVVLEPAPGFPTGIGFYLSGLEEVRHQLCDILRAIPDDAMTRRAFAEAHPIAGLALHIGEAEWWWIQCVLAGRELDDEARRIAHWDVLEDADGLAARGCSGQYCIDALETIRGMTRDFLASLTDDALDRTFKYEKPTRSLEVSLRWALHHLMDHEAQHKGQILLLKRLLCPAST